MLSEETKFQILTDHYKDTFDFLQQNLKQRDRLFLGVLCILIVILFQIYTPQEALNLLSQFISDKLNIATNIDLLFIQSIIWFGLLATTIKYFQLVIFIERQYNYIHQLEDQISNEYANKAFTREGVSYLKEYPIFLTWASFLYTMLFPSILSIISISKIISEFKLHGAKILLVWFNLAIFVFLVISTGFYIFVLHFKKKDT